MSDLAIYTNKLTKRYGAARGLESLDLEVHRGEVFGFLGPNGAGKSTTIRLLLDLLRPTAGTLHVLGRDPRADGPQLRAEIGYLPGELALDGRRNGRSLLVLLSRLRDGCGSERIEALARRLGADLDRPVRALSKGNKQKIGLIQAFMHDPALLVLDEPTSGLDPLVQQKCLALVREARDRGATVFMSSHVLSEVQLVADRVAIIREGELLLVDEVEAIRRRAMRRVELKFADEPDRAEFAHLPRIHELELDGHTLRCSLTGSPDDLLKVAARHEITDLVAGEPDLEQIFLDEYAKEPAGAAL